MDNDELMRLRGQQVTLEKERGEIRKQIDTERAALEGFASGLRSAYPTLGPNWLENEIARLRRIAELFQRHHQVDSEVHSLKRKTGL